MFSSSPLCNVVVQSGFLDPRPPMLNGRNLSALYKIVNSRERNPRISAVSFFGKQIVNWGLAHNLGKDSTLNHFDHCINYKNRFLSRPT
jgi:hypothetical protein